MLCIYIRAYSSPACPPVRSLALFHIHSVARSFNDVVHEYSFFHSLSLTLSLPRPLPAFHTILYLSSIHNTRAHTHSVQTQQMFFVVWIFVVAVSFSFFFFFSSLLAICLCSVFRFRMRYKSLWLCTTICSIYERSVSHVDGFLIYTDQIIAYGYTHFASTYILYINTHYNTLYTFMWYICGAIILNRACNWAVTSGGSYDFNVNGIRIFTETPRILVDLKIEKYPWNSSQMLDKMQ